MARCVAVVCICGVLCVSSSVLWLQLVSLFMNGCQLNDRMVSVLCEALRANKSVENLDLSNNKYGCSLCAHFPPVSAICRVSCCVSRIRDAGTAFLAACIKGYNRTIKVCCVSCSEASVCAGLFVGSSARGYLSVCPDPRPQLQFSKHRNRDSDGHHLAVFSRCGPHRPLLQPPSGVRLSALPH